MKREDTQQFNVVNNVQRKLQFNLYMFLRTKKPVTKLHILTFSVICLHQSNKMVANQKIVTPVLQNN